MFDVSAVLLQNAFETTSPFTTLARISATPRSILSLQQAQNSLLFRQTVDGLYFLRLSSTLLLSILFNKPARLVLLNILMLKFPL